MKKEDYKLYLENLEENMDKEAKKARINVLVDFIQWNNVIQDNELLNIFSKILIKEINN